MWLIFALASSLLLGVRRVYEKRLSPDFGNFSLSFATLAFALPFLFVLLFFFPLPGDIAHLSWQFWWPLITIWLLIYPLQNYLLYRSLREGELSRVAPVSALLPVCNIVPSFFVLAELPTLYGLVGILATVLGTYLLLTDGVRGTQLNKPVLFMVGSVVCTAIGSTLDKVSIEAATPFFYSFVNILGGSVVFLFLMFVYGEGKDLRKIGAHARTFTMLGAVLALAFIAFAVAFSLGPTSYTLAIRSGGFMLAALWGIFFLHESFSARKKLALALFVLGTLALAIG